jgi:methyl-accepting chemotaxis protein
MMQALTNAINQMKVSTKMFAALALMGVAIIILGWFFVSNQLALIEFDEYELRGIEYNTELRQLTESMARHRGATASLRSGDQAFQSKVDSAKAAVEDAFDEIAVQNEKHDDAFNVSLRYESIRSDWKQLLSSGSEHPAKNFKEHTLLIEKALALYSHVNSVSNLDLDPGADSYALMSATYNTVFLNEVLGKLRGLGAKAIAQQDAGELTRASLIYLGESKALFKLIESQLAFLLKVSKEAQSDLKSDIERAEESYLAFKTLTEDVFVSGKAQVNAQVYFETGTQAISALFSLYDNGMPLLAKKIESRRDGYRSAMVIELIIVAGLVLLAVLVFIRLNKGIVSRLRATIDTFEAIKNANYSTSMDISSQDEIGMVMSSLLRMQDVLRANIEAEQRTAAENARIKMSLDSSTANVMVTDTDYNIIYFNDALREMLTIAESDIRKDLPGFSVDKLMGSNIDIFHKNPAHQRDILDKITEPYTAKLSIGGRTIRVIASPIIDEQGNRIGMSAQWRDLTDELKKQEAERSVASENARIKKALDMVNANVMVTDKDLNIIYCNKAIKRMFENAESDIQTELRQFKVSEVMGANIDIFHKHPAHQRGLLAKITDTYTANFVLGGRHLQVMATPVIDDSGDRIGYVAEWEDQTNEVIAQNLVQNLVEQAAAGELDARIDESKLAGAQAKLGSGINSLLDSVVAPVKETIRVVDLMASGDLTHNMPTDFTGEFARLAGAVNQSLSKLNTMVSEITESAESVSASAKEIAQGNADLSQRTEEQASSLEETASSMEQFTSTVRQNADNSTNAATLANEASKRAQEGGKVVGTAVDAMAEINKSSRQIADIISVIDDIAFQTNLLALNAAVEAARAGEQGRGFAVVASEVRNLAQRSAGAAKEIKSLINASVQSVEQGSKLVNESGETLADIVRSVEQVNAIIAEINNASLEQASGIEEVNRAIAQMDEMTQQNAALVEEATASSEALDEQSNKMVELIGFFNVNGDVVSKSGAAAAVEKAPPSSTAIVSPVNKEWSAGADDEWEEF